MPKSNLKKRTTHCWAGAQQSPFLNSHPPGLSPVTALPHPAGELPAKTGPAHWHQRRFQDEQGRNSERPVRACLWAHSLPLVSLTLLHDSPGVDLSCSLTGAGDHPRLCTSWSCHVSRLAVGPSTLCLLSEHCLKTFTLSLWAPPASICAEEECLCVSE